MLKKIGAPLYCQNKTFGFEQDGFHWKWWSDKTRLENLPVTSLLLQNMSTVLMVVELLQPSFAVSRETIIEALKKVSLMGRMQIVPGDVTMIYDVSHNPASVTLLANYLKSHSIFGKTHAIFSMLADKDIATTIAVIKEHIDDWNIAPLQCERAATQEMLTQYFSQHLTAINKFDSIKQAIETAKKQANAGDRIVVFGSFHTVAEAAPSNVLRLVRGIQI